MVFGRGFGFKGWSPPWPFVGLGRGGLPRCWVYGSFWGAAYPYAYGMTHPYGFEAYPYGWGMDFPYPYYAPMYPYGYSAGYPYGFGPRGFPYGGPMSPEAEKECLKSQADSLKQQIDQINRRITELERE